MQGFVITSRGKLSVINILFTTISSVVLFFYAPSYSLAVLVLPALSSILFVYSMAIQPIYEQEFFFNRFIEVRKSPKTASFFRLVILLLLFNAIASGIGSYVFQYRITLDAFIGSIN